MTEAMADAAGDETSLPRLSLRRQSLRCVHDSVSDFSGCRKGMILCVTSLDAADLQRRDSREDPVRICAHMRSVLDGKHAMLGTPGK